jgi:hypothetical protein
MKENTKFVNIGDYWNDETLENIAYFLCEYHDLFPNTFSQMKGIIGELGKMKIQLNLDSEPVR